MMELELPTPTAGLTSALSVGMNDDGTLHEMVHLLGGCKSPYIPILRDDSALPDDEDEDFVLTNLPHEFVCPEVSDSVFIFDPTSEHTNVMIEGKSMPRKRHRHSSIAVNGLIWVIGGVDEYGFMIDEIDVYDSIKEEWKTLDTGLELIEVPGPTEDSIISHQMADHCAFEIDGFIFITGGYDSFNNALSHTIMIDTVASIENNTLVYEFKSPLLNSRGSCSATVHANYAFVAGGFTHDDGFCEAMKSVEIYDAISDEWFEMEHSMKQGRANSALFYYQGKIVAFGGENRGSFDAATGKCKDPFHSNKLDLETNMQLPGRLTYPISHNVVEILDLITDSKPNFAAKWKSKKTKLISHDKAKFSVLSFPLLDQVFLIGGASYNLHEILSPKTVVSCNDCVMLNPDIEVFVDPFDVDNMTVPIFVSVIVFVCAIFTVAVSIKRYRRYQETTKEENNSTQLIQNQRWDGDVFSSDLDLEEIEWNEENVELKEIS